MKWKPSDFKAIDSYFITNSGSIRAWVIHPGDWFWLKWDGEPAKGPYKTEAAVRLAVELLYDADHEPGTWRRMIDIHTRRE